jgi:hypothetical protein
VYRIECGFAWRNDDNDFHENNFKVPELSVSDDFGYFTSTGKNGNHQLSNKIQGDGKLQY